MDIKAMRGHLKQCQEAYAKAPMLAKTQTRAFMEPMLELMAGVVENFEELREAWNKEITERKQGGEHGNGT